MFKSKKELTKYTKAFIQREWKDEAQRFDLECNMRLGKGQRSRIV